VTKNQPNRPLSEKSACESNPEVFDMEDIIQTIQGWAKSAP
jgi:hypothetical protein